jgi:hypothetical protein
LIIQALKELKSKNDMKYRILGELKPQHGVADCLKEK